MRIIKERVCPRCGGKLEQRDKKISSCERCQIFTWGVSERIYKIAKELVAEGYIQYKSIDRPNNEEEKDYWIKIQTEGNCDLILKILSKLMEAS